MIKPNADRDRLIALEHFVIELEVALGEAEAKIERLERLVNGRMAEKPPLEERDGWRHAPYWESLPHGSSE